MKTIEATNFVFARCRLVREAHMVAIAVDAVLLLYVYKVLGTPLHKAWVVEQPFG